MNTKAFCPMHLLLNIINIHSYVNSMLASSEMQWNIDMHRASTFNQLYEASVLKEMADTSHSMAGTPIGIEQTALNELDGLKILPESSYKWTWGESLTKADVVALRRPGEIAFILDMICD